MKRLDLIGEKFGRLTVASLHSAVAGKVRWGCLCDCGRERIVSTTHLRSGHTVSCGCARAEITAARNVANATHGMWKTPEFEAWSSMRKRCYTPGAHGYERYGGRGITVCDEWKDSFEAFFAYIGPRPTPDHSIDRIRNAEGYKPGNVRWATSVEQNNNRRSNVTARVGDVTLTASQISQRFGLPYATVLYRIRTGKSGGELIAPSQKRGFGE